MRRKTVEEYLESIWVLEMKDGCAHTGAIASKMGVRPPSVTEMLQKLQMEGFVTYQPFIGAKLTRSGRKKARELMRKHRVIADFIEFLGIGRELAEVDACEMEHHVSKRTMERLEKFVTFVRDAPRDPRWISHYHHYCDTGERIGCALCNEEGGEKGERVEG